MASYPDQHFTVTASHSSSRFAFKDAPVRTRYDAGYKGWYATGSLGCTKICKSAHDAVHKLFADHACFNIQVSEHPHAPVMTCTCKGFRAPCTCRS